ncbi:uncharacterized protein ARMOST_10071 [Armillaria ostoyae]|uniref:Uncharacterized protein n=1 Tax=Armillaria ostoyae TaxID=47428 RepID=A0A284RDA7_ARMOS|nr:uncharacterized protein ARMOST_10071 [Armillaria ostoyae]
MSPSAQSQPEYSAAYEDLRRSQRSLLCRL